MRTSGDPTVITADDDLVTDPLDSCRPGTFEQPNTTPQEVLLERGGNLRILLRQHLLATHHQGDLGAHRLEHVHELHTGHTGPHHDHMLGHQPRRIRISGGQHAFAVDRRPLGNTGSTARRQHDHIGIETPLRSVRQRCDHPIRTIEAADAIDELDALTGEKTPDGALKARLDGTEPIPQLFEIDIGTDLGETHPR